MVVVLKKRFLKILQYSQVNICVGFSFLINLLSSNHDQNAHDIRMSFLNGYVPCVDNVIVLDIK